MKTLQKIFLFVLCISFCFFCRANEGQPIAQRGVLDLRNSNLFNNSLNTNGEWTFYWNRLLSPDSISSVTPDYVSFPVLWNNIKQGGKALPSVGYATYKLTILLPKKRPRIGMEIPDSYCALRLYVDGVVQAEEGKPATSKDSAKPVWATRYIAIPPGERDTLTLVLQVANFWHYRGGVYKSIVIGDKDALFLRKNRDEAYDFGLTGCTIMGGLFFLALFIFARQDKTILYFAIFCIVFSYRMVGTGWYFLHSLAPDLSWFLTIRLEYLSLSVAMGFFCIYTRSLYPKDVKPVITNGLIWICFGYSAIVLFSPTTFFTQLISAFLGVMFFCMAYSMYVFLMAARNKRSGSVFALASTAIVLFIGLLMDLHYFGLVGEWQVVNFFCYISFFFLQSLALSHRFAHHFRQATIQAEQGLKAKTEFLSTMSHEIRTPLNAVIGMTHLLLSGDPRPDQEEDLDVLLFSANNLLSIVNNILDYNKIEEGKINIERIQMDLGGIANNIVAGLKNAADEKAIRLIADVDDRLDKMVIGDPTRTSQVINNLVHNAIKFTKEGSVRLSIAVDRVFPEMITVTVRVRDTGIGIPKEKQDMIFDRFTQADSSTSRSYGGTGLGLAISKKILELQGVDLQLESEPGEGSCFFFTQTFPVGEALGVDSGKNAGTAGREALLQNVSILLVEDNPLNVLVAQTMLENNGAVVEVATNGVEALERLDAARHQLVLMDLHMPVMDGYEATVLLRERGETLPIIALTASMPKEVESDAFAAGLNDVILKPFSPDELYRVILQHVSV